MSGSSTGSGSGAAALRAAATIGDVAACQRYLTGVRCVRFSRDEHGRSALHLAATGGHAQIVRLLLNVAAPKECDTPDGAGCTALQRAAADGHEDILRLLLARGADVDKQDNIHKNSALHETSWKGYSRCVRLLAAAGASLSTANAGGFTPLHLCCQNGHNQSCRELLLAGCRPDLQNNYGDTALHTAARYGHAGVTRILISAQCAVSAANKNGDTALHIAAAMGRRKLTRILLEAGCERGVRNKQGESAGDIARRKDLGEIVAIVEGAGGAGKVVVERTFCRGKSKRSEQVGGRGSKRSKSKVRFETKHTKSTDIVDTKPKSRHWSPYGCHYYPDPEAFPSPRLDSLPPAPLERGEQYYLDLAGNIRKGPVGVGYTCYCAPLFRHLEARLERDARALQRAHARLGRRVAGLERAAGRCSERCPRRPAAAAPLPRARSLEALDAREAGGALQGARSADELDGRPTVRQLVARIQAKNAGNQSESSDDEDAPLRMEQFDGVMEQSNLAVTDYENVPLQQEMARTRSAVYSPESGGGGAGDAFFSSYQGELAPQFAKMRLFNGKAPARGLDSHKMFQSTVGKVGPVDRDNNDSGYSTKVYGSSKGNSPSLSGQIPNDCVGASSLV